MTTSNGVGGSSNGAWRWITGALACLVLLTSASGCSLWPGSQLKKCRNESNRVLGLYQLETQRAERLEVQNRALAARVSDLEKRLAMIYETSDPARGLAGVAMPNPGISSQAFPSQAMAGQVTAGQVTAGQVTAGQVTAGQVMSGQGSGVAGTEPRLLPSLASPMPANELPQSAWRAAPRRNF